ncbi:RING finger protein unkempt homolog isoform X2 [Pyxicephalus adspersus]|uniref:RING finger protein unkempt homolog isoform X2 n=1 Tax=Pyxicephalus adspersus TaxID=30357 RepID=UPI003B5949B2
MSKGLVTSAPSASSAPPAAVASGGLHPQTEKPNHYTYLKEFRTEQCHLFVHHKCTQHRPYTCFNWHFVNQRRRRSVRRRDGTFNYSPDIYCTKYDETTGLCPEGDEELQAMEALQNGQTPMDGSMEGQTAVAASHAMIEKILGEEPRWQDTTYVLGHYKTEQCKKPPRLCRQGYACPYYHNSKDRRRSPRQNKYRSSPCPNVKHSDEWGDPSKCESGDSCQYCHTRTEQQFHPEIYKSTKCNDMQQFGTCPRGPFCAFAHPEHSLLCDDLQSHSAVSSPTQTGPIMYMPSAAGDSVPVSPSSPHAPDFSSVWSTMSHLSTNPSPASILCASVGSPTHQSGSPSASLGKPHNLDSLGFHGELSGSYKKAPGCEREDSTGTDYVKSYKIQAKLKPHPNEHRSQDQSLLQSKQDALGIMPMGSPLTSSISSSITSSLAATPPSPAAISGVPGMNANALPFYPTSDTVESVIESALDDLDLNDFGVAALEKSYDNNAVATPGVAMIGGSQMQSSAPVNIPGSISSSASFHSTSPSSPVGISSHFMHQAPGAHSQSDNTFLSTSATHSSLGLNGMNNSIWENFVPGSYSPGTSPAYPSGADSAEVVKLRQELDDANKTIKAWEESWKQAKQLCEAWKKEAEEANERTKAARAECELAREQRDALEQQVKKLQEDHERYSRTQDSPLINSVSSFENLSLSTLKSIQTHLHTNLEKVEKVECQHGVLCELCATEDEDCSNCQLNISPVLQP